MRTFTARVTVSSEQPARHANVSRPGKEFEPSASAYVAIQTPTLTTLATSGIRFPTRSTSVRIALIHAVRGACW